MISLYVHEIRIFLHMWCIGILSYIPQKISPHEGNYCWFPENLYPIIHTSILCWHENIHWIFTSDILLGCMKQSSSKTKQVLHLQCLAWQVPLRKPHRADLPRGWRAGPFIGKLSKVQEADVRMHQHRWFLHIFGGWMNIHWPSLANYLGVRRFSGFDPPPYN